MSPDEKQALRDWLRANSPISEVDEISPIKGGGSCEMFEISSGRHKYVLRRAPRAAVSDTAHDVLREQRIIFALQNSGVRVPEVVAACHDDSVLGADFFVMTFIEAEVIRRKLPQHYIEKPECQTHIGEQLIDALVELHRFEWRGTDIEALAQTEGFLARQVQRWLAQLDAYQCRELRNIGRIAEWLSDRLPPRGDLTVMHGDYKVDNVMFSKDLPPKVLSIVDFEMTTIGDPLIDLAWAMIFWPEPGNTIAIAAPDMDGGMDERFIQPPEQLIERYARATGRDLTHYQWYEVFAAFKLAIVLEGSYAKHLSGESKNPNHQFFGFVVDELLKRALTKMAS